MPIGLAMNRLTTTNSCCRICERIGPHPLFIGREMMFGTREEFKYFKCGKCGCLQIKSIPSNLYNYYGESYYSFTRGDDSKPSRLLRILQRERCRNALFRRGYKLNKILSKLVDLPKEIYSLKYLLRHARLNNFDAKILDIGCGITSWWLSSLYNLGFNNLVGVDPFIPCDNISSVIKIYKNEIDQLTGKYDLITLHHSLEHMPDQKAVMKNISRLLSDDGVCIIRIPIVSSYVWEKYGTNWVEMDPPRHIYLHSNKSIELLGEACGLNLIETEYDSLPLEFYGSEQYLHNIPLSDPSSFWINKETDRFTAEELAKFDQQANKVNRNKTGGRAAFFFTKVK